MPAPRKNKASQHQLAEKWGTTQKNVSLMRDSGCDFDAPDKEVARWLLKNAKRKSKPMREAIALVLKPKTPESGEPEGQRSLDEMRDYYASKLDAATKSEDVDHEAIKFWNDLWLKADESIRRSQAHEKKLGIEQGEILSRGEVERILRAMFWAGNACCDKFSKQIAQRLSDKKPAEIHKMLKPFLTASALFQGLKRVAKTPGDMNLPQWVIDCADTEEKQYLEYDEWIT